MAECSLPPDPRAAAVACRVAGETLELLPGRALYWPRASTLLVADLHLGKAGVFRQQGLPVPRGTTAADLAGLSELLTGTGAGRLVVLGDFGHAAATGEEAWLVEFANWRRTHASLAVTVVRGNHDAPVSPDPGLGLDWRTESPLEPPFVLAHEPGADPRGYVLAGHLHPVMTLRAGGDRLRFPVFWLRAAHAVLPAFGGFTGGAPVVPGAGERAFAAGDTSVIVCHGG